MTYDDHLPNRLRALSEPVASGIELPTSAAATLHAAANKIEQLEEEVASLRLTLGGRTFSSAVPPVIGCPIPGACAQVAEIKRLQAQNANLQDALMGVVASLAAAISLLVRGGKAIKKTVASDKMFDQMMVDYRASIGQAVLAYKQGTPE